jgi:hypothetical protein
MRLLFDRERLQLHLLKSYSVQDFIVFPYHFNLTHISRNTIELNEI